MSIEELGKNEDLLLDASSAELSPTDSADLDKSIDAAPESSGAVADVESARAAEEPATAPQEIAQAEAAADAGAMAESVTAAEQDVEAESPAVADAAEVLDESAAPEQDAEAESPAVADAAEVLDESPAAEQGAEAESPAVAEAAEVVDESAAPEEDKSDPAEPSAEAPTEEGTESAASEEQPETGKPEAAAPAIEEAKVKRGQVYHGVISSTTPTAVYVDLGDGDQGLVPGRELELMTRKMLESLAVGAEVDVYVVNPRNHRGETILSINHALEELDWRNAQKFSKSKQVLDALIGGYNKGGLIVRFGRLRGFVPQSQLAEDRIRAMTGGTPEERYGPMVNQPIGVKVMEVDRHRNRLILSERAANRDVRQNRKEALIADLNVGDIRKGKVVSLENFGAFVDIGGGEGLIHLSELAWGHITHPRQAVNIGEEVEVEVISIDPDAKRIGLSRRRVISDPWDEIATSLRRGQLVRSRVTKLTKFGAFARLIDYDAVEGLIHISELSGERVTHPREVVNRGDELVVRIVKIDIKERRLGLSLKSVNSTEFLDLDWEMALQESAALPQPAAEAEATDVPAQAESED